jgi:lipopolysaccharide export system protein LptA
VSRRTLTLTVLCCASVVMGSTVALQPALSGTPVTQLISAAMTGGTANGYGDRPNISPDGTTITFDSDATNMSSDPPGFGKLREIFSRDLTTGTTQLVSIGFNPNNPAKAAAANAWSSYSWPDQNGALVTFTSDATNLVHVTVPHRAIYLRNTSSQAVNGIQPHTTVLVSATPSGTPANGVSSRSMITPNGDFIAFDSTATNLTSTPNAGQSQEYLYNVLTKTTSIVSADANGVAGNAMSYRGMVADDGATVTVDSKSTNLTPSNTNGQENIYLKNMNTGAIKAVSNKGQGQASGSRPYMTPNGKWITFNSNAALLSSDTNATTDVYVYNVDTGVLTLGSPGMNGAPGNGESLRGFITGDGRYVVFNSFATNMAPKDTNGHGDCFVYDTTTHVVTMASRGADGEPANGNSFRPVPSNNGAQITFLSQATNLVPGGSAPAPKLVGAASTITPNDDETTNYEVFAVVLASLIPGGDTKAPTAAVTSPASKATVRSPVKISGTASDNVAVDSVGVAIEDNTTGGANSGKWLQPNGSFGTSADFRPATLGTPHTASTTWSLPSVALPNSSYLVQVKVVDSSANTPSAKPSSTFTVHTVKPPPPPDTHVAAHLKHATAARVNRHHRRVRVVVNTAERITATVRLLRHGNLIAKGKPHLLRTTGRHRLTLAIPKSVRHGPGRVVVVLRDAAGNIAQPHLKVHVPR